MNSLKAFVCKTREHISDSCSNPSVLCMKFNIVFQSSCSFFFVSRKVSLKQKLSTYFLILVTVISENISYNIYLIILTLISHINAKCKKNARSSTTRAESYNELFFITLYNKTSKTVMNPYMTSQVLFQMVQKCNVNQYKRFFNFK